MYLTGYNYKITKNLKVCPVCYKAKDIIPIEYGLIVFKYNNDGNIIHPEKEFYSGGCVTTRCQPTQYCKRCEHKF